MREVKNGQLHLVCNVFEYLLNKPRWCSHVLRLAVVACNVFDYLFKKPRWCSHGLRLTAVACNVILFVSLSVRLFICLVACLFVCPVFFPWFLFQFLCFLMINVVMGFKNLDESFDKHPQFIFSMCAFNTHNLWGVISGSDNDCQCLYTTHIRFYDFP